MTEKIYTLGTHAGFHYNAHQSDRISQSEDLTQIARIVTLLQMPDGTTLSGMVRETGLTKQQCRTILRTIVDQGGALELRTDATVGTDAYFLHDASLTTKEHINV